jgi:hypothetical protein
LLDLAQRRGGPRDPVWEAAAASIQMLFWCDRFTEAAELAETLIAQDGPAGGELCDQDIPFDAALLAAQAHAGISAHPRLVAAAGQIPEGRILGTDLLWLAEQLPARSVEELLPSHGDWGDPVKPLDGVIGAHLVELDYSTLTAREKGVVWQALSVANDFPRAHELAESSGETPEQFAICLWMAGWYAVKGETALGEKLLLAAHGRWWPYMKWDAIPDSIVLQPTLRLVATDRVREHYLTQPIGPEAG